MKAQKVAVLTYGWGGFGFTQAFDENCKNNNNKNNKNKNKKTFTNLLLVSILKDRIKCVAMSNSVHTRDLIKNEGARAWLFSVSERMKDLIYKC